MKRFTFVTSIVYDAETAEEAWDMFYQESSEEGIDDLEWAMDDIAYDYETKEYVDAED